MHVPMVHALGRLSMTLQQGTVKLARRRSNVKSFPGAVMLKFPTPSSSINCALGMAARSAARRAYWRLLRDAQHANAIQERTLLRRLESNAQSEFGRNHKFSSIRNYDDFAKSVPVRDYEQFRPYIQRVMDGNERALFGPRHRVLMFAMTSGSTDRPKYIPITQQFVREYRRGWNAFGGKAMLDHPEAFLRGILQVTSPLDVERTSQGIPCGSISGLLAREQSHIVRRYYVTPPQVAKIADPESRYYTIMRFAVPRDVGWMVTASPATPLKLARTVVEHTDRLIRDVHDGTLSPPRSIPCSLVTSFKGHLKPAPRTAARLEALRSQRGTLLPKDYWRLAFLANWTGGTLALHVREFPSYFGDAPVRDIGLLATEGRVSIGLTKASTSGLLDVGAGFFEFAELDDSTHRAVRRCHELDTGGVYRVIMTTSAGLYRYDIGDCVRVAGYEGRTPLLEFLHRGARASSMAGEKITEWQVTSAMQRAGEALGIPTTNFVLAPAWIERPFYRVYLEESQVNPAGIATGMEQELCRLNMEYAGKRNSSRLGPIQLVRLPSGTLAQWEHECMHNHRSGEQYKHQYLFIAPGDDARLIEMSHQRKIRGTMAERDRDTAAP